MPNDRPNILMIICHDIGQHCGLYDAGVETPNIDAIAHDGIYFSNYHCSAAQCSPSRGSIFTGKYPHNNGLVGLAHIGWEYNAGEITLQSALQGAGYSTHLFGIQHETGQDAHDLGYDEVVPGTAAKAAAENVCNWLEQRAESGRDEPWFVSMGTAEPHRPYEREGYPRDDEDSVKIQPWLPDRPGIRYDTAGLNGLVQVLDEAVGRVRETLTETGLADDTLLIFTTDHGTAMPRAKGTCYDPGTLTALAMHMPGRYEGGTHYDELLTNCDFMPTMLELVGAPVEHEIDGRSFLGLIDERDYDPRDSIFSEMTWHDTYNPMRAIRTNRHKYVRNFGDRPLVYMPLDTWDGPAGEEMRYDYYSSWRPEHELYDLQADPLEMNNVADDADYAEVFDDLRGRVEDWMYETHDRILEGPWPPSDKQAAREAEGHPN